MAFSSLGIAGGANKNSSSTSQNPLVTTTIAVDSILLLIIALDNINTTDGDFSEVTSVTDVRGNVYTKLGEWTNGQGTAATGATISAWFTRVTTQLVNNDTLTVTFSSALIDSSSRLRHFSVTAGNSIRVAGSVQTLSNDGADPGSMTISGLTNKEYLFLRAIASESETTTFTVTTNYTSYGSQVSSISGATDTNMVIAGEFRILTGTGDTSNPTIVSADSASIYMALEEYTPTSVTKTLASLGVG